MRYNDDAQCFSARAKNILCTIVTFVKIYNNEANTSGSFFKVKLKINTGAIFYFFSHDAA